MMFWRKKDEPDEKTDEGIIDNLVFEPASIEDIRDYLLITKSIDIAHLFFLHTQNTNNLIDEVMRLTGYFPEDVQENIKAKVSDYTKKVLDELYKNVPKRDGKLMATDVMAYSIAVMIATSMFLHSMSFNLSKYGIEEMKKRGAIEYSEFKRQAGGD